MRKEIENRKKLNQSRMTKIQKSRVLEQTIKKPEESLGMNSNEDFKTPRKPNQGSY